MEMRHHRSRWRRRRSHRTAEGTNHRSAGGGLAMASRCSRPGDAGGRPVGAGSFPRCGVHSTRRTARIGVGTGPNAGEVRRWIRASRCHRLGAAEHPVRVARRGGLARGLRPAALRYRGWRGLRWRSPGFWGKLVV
ncbi:putative pollen-specific leucine-rich repeat extensin-like protein 3 [Iris pallida]|uniref:Pollen-specific leucine-rich repeat extensin-like protein 3 n=1 Tax=Iris pallida TaxID=29817 RepID=A0AAX6HXF2_IRIPA|nr:putative pollen-specific leucine-rich repeat extensin-like protein 3 [Iris pallida]